jgi:hypothetical protein
MQGIRDQNAYVLLTDLIYITEDGTVIIVPAGFHTNLASVPGVVKWYIDDNNYEIRSPSVTHDFLYSAESKDIGFNRKEADGVLREAMIGLGMRRSKAYLIYYILRAFGGSHWEER